MQPRKITLGTLNIHQTGKDYVNQVLDSNRLSAGPFTRKFESEFAKLHGCKHGVFMSSGTCALQVALAALKEIHGYQEGDEVIVPATTFIATSNIVIQNGLTPVFVDVDPRTFNINPNMILDAITKRTRCILPVHLFGLPADMRSIMKIANRHQLQVLEDSCETVSATQRGQSIGSFGDAACFSNYIAHHVTGGVGGLITTNDDQLAEISRSLMQHGRDSIYTNINDDDNADDALLKEMIQRRYNFERLGYSYRCTEIEAALALSELERLDDNLLIRRANARFLTNLLSDIDFLQLPLIPNGMTHSYMMYPIILDSDMILDKFLLHLERNGIETRLMFPLLDSPVYRKLFPGLEHEFPVAKNLSKQGFFIGCHQGLLPKDVQYISEIMHAFQP